MCAQEMCTCGCAALAAALGDVGLRGQWPALATPHLCKAITLILGQKYKKCSTFCSKRQKVTFSLITLFGPTVPSQISADLDVGRRPTDNCAEICEGTVGRSLSMRDTGLTLLSVVNHAGCYMPVQNLVSLVEHFQIWHQNEENSRKVLTIC